MLTVLLTAALGTTVAGGQPLVAQPATQVVGVAPEVVTAKVEKDDILVSRIEVEVEVPVRVKKATAVDGKQVIVEETVLQRVKQTRERRWPLKGTTAQTAGGKKLELADLRKLLATPRPVVVAPDGRMPAAAYLKALAPNAIVIAAREATSPVPPGTPLPPRLMPVEKR